MQIPTPESTLLQIMVLLSAPPVLVALVAVSLAIVSWFTWTKGAARGGERVVRASASLFFNRTTATSRAQLLLAALASAFVALFFVGSRIVTALIADGRLGNSPSIWSGNDSEGAVLQVVLTGEWTSTTSWLFAWPVASLFLLGVAQISSWRLLYYFVIVAWVPVGIAGLLAGCLTAFLCVVNFVLGGLLGLQGKYEPEFTLSNALTFFLLTLSFWGGPKLGSVLLEESGPALGGVPENH